MDLWSVVLALCAAALAFYYYFRRNIFKEHGIPCNKSTPIIGDFWKTLLQRTSIAELVQELYNMNKEAKYVGLYDMSSPTFLIRDAELIKSITVKNFEHFRNHRSFTVEGQDPLFENLFSLKDERWREVRNTISPIFTSSKLKNMFVLMRECAQTYGEALVNLPTDQKIVELKDMFTRYTNDVIATCAFGISINSLTDKENEFYLYGKRVTIFNRAQIFQFFVARVCPWLAKLLNWKIIGKKEEKYFMNIIASNIKEREEKGINRPDMIQLLMESRDRSGNKLSLMEIAANAFVFFFAGFENVATLMCFSAYEIGVNEEVQRRLHEEIDKVLAECNGEVTYEALQSMKYLDAIINEALRLYPVQVIIDRVCTKKFELPPALPGLKPYVLEEGSYINFPVYGIHHDEKYYEEPNKFNPDRYLGDTKLDLNSGIFLPFGIGPRMCVANRFVLLEAKVLLFHVFAKCYFKPCEKTTIPLVLSKKSFSMIPENGFWFEILPRKQTL